MNKTIKIILGIIALIIIILLVRVGVDKKIEVKPTKEIKIGFVLPLTGVYASFGEEFQRGAQIALDEIQNNKPEIIFEDGALEVKKTFDAVTKLVQVNNVDAIVASAYMDAAATHHISDEKKIPMFVLWDSNKQLEDMGDYVFAIGPWTPASGEVSAIFAREKLQAKTVGIFGYKQEWSISVSEAFKEQFQKSGGEVVYQAFSKPGEKDYRTELLKLKNLNPDVVYMTTEEMFVGIKQLREIGYKGSIITSDILDNETVAKNPDIFEGVYQSQVADPSFDETKKYIDLYKKKFGNEPKKLLFGTWGYDAVWVVYNASHKETITKGLYATQNYKGASGTISFNPEGSSKTIPAMFIVRSGNIEKID